MHRRHKAVALIHATLYANVFDDSKHEVIWEPVSTESFQRVSPTATPHAVFAKPPMPICASPEMIGLRAASLRVTGYPMMSPRRAHRTSLRAISKPPQSVELFLKHEGMNAKARSVRCARVLPTRNGMPHCICTVKIRTSIGPCLEGLGYHLRGSVLLRNVALALLFPARLRI